MSMRVADGLVVSRVGDDAREGQEFGKPLPMKLCSCRGNLLKAGSDFGLRKFDPPLRLELWCVGELGRYYAVGRLTARGRLLQVFVAIVVGLCKTQRLGLVSPLGVSSFPCRRSVVACFTDKLRKKKGGGQ